MIHYLMERLWAHIVVHNPEFMEKLKEDNSVTQYLETKVNVVIPILEQHLSEGKPDYAAAELCLNLLIEDLMPSRFDYIQNMLLEDFREERNDFVTAGTLFHESVKLVEVLKHEFEEVGFSEENKEHSKVYYAIATQVSLYLEAQKNT